MKSILVFGSAIIFILQCSLGWAEKVQTEEYLLSSGDILEISVWNDESLHREVMIRPDGRLSFPLIGDVKAAGRPVGELKAELEHKINEYVPGTPVTVIVNNIRYPGVFIVGKVANPGQYPMEKKLTVVQALAMAGGLNAFASKNNIIVLRQNSHEQKVFNFRYGDMEDGRKLEQNIALIDGDTIVVP